MIPIVYITDDRYVMPTVVSIISFAKNACSKPREVYILTHDISPENGKKLDAIHEPNIICHRINMDRNEFIGSESYCDMLANTHVSSCANYKFDIANVLQDYDRALYLDSDIIVNQNIEELFTLDLEDYYLAAADDMGGLSENGVSELAARIGITDRAYFNSGVMLLNLKKIRNDRKVEQLYRYIEEEVNFFVDQDALNAVLGEKRQSLPLCYNFMTKLIDHEGFERLNQQQFAGKYSNPIECIQDQKIIHMTDRYKPWEYDINHVTDIFWKYYMQSPYREEPLSLISYEHLMMKQKEEIIQKLRDRRKLTEWRFPYDIIKKKARVVLYGAGSVGRSLYSQNKYTDYCQIVLWVDREYQQLDNVRAPEAILDAEYDIIVLAVLDEKSRREIMAYLTSMGAESAKIYEYSADVIS